MVNADGVNVQLIRGGVPCFVDTTNDNKVSWLPPRWSQEKIQNFLSKVRCRHLFHIHSNTFFARPSTVRDF